MKTIPITRLHEAVDVPASAFEPKPWFSERLSDADVDAILDFIRERQAPHLWPGHTHTPPPKNPQIVYLGEYQLRSEHAAPCPCCIPRHAKYFLVGMIAWFPDERVIRLMGHKCFARLAPEIARKAMDKYQEETDRKKLIRFLLGSYEVVLTAEVAIRKNLPVTSALDGFSSDLHRIIYSRLDMPIWPHIRTGELQVEENGYFRRFAPIEGHRILSEPRKSIANQLRAAWARLKSVDPRVMKGEADTLTDKERRAAADAIRLGMNEARGAIAELDERRRFVSLQTTGTLRSWGQHPGCPCPLFIRREGAILRIGRGENRVFPLQIPAELDGSICPIPVLPILTLPARLRSSAAKSEAA